MVRRRYKNRPSKEERGGRPGYERPPSCGVVGRRGLANREGLPEGGECRRGGQSCCAKTNLKRQSRDIRFEGQAARKDEVVQGGEFGAAQRFKKEDRWDYRREGTQMTLGGKEDLRKGGKEEYFKRGSFFGEGGERNENQGGKL